MSRQGHLYSDRAHRPGAQLGLCLRDKIGCTIGMLVRQESSAPCRDRIFVSRQGRGWEWATMGRDRGFPCRDIVPLTSCRDKEIVSRRSVAKSGRRCVMTGQRN